MKNKVFASFDEAVSDIPDGATVMAFTWGMGRGNPQNLLRALNKRGSRNLTAISQNFVYGRVGNHFFSLDEVCTPLILAEQVKKVITTWAGLSYYGMTSRLEGRIAAGEVELELTGHGTLAERIRAGASGLGGFYTPVGVDTIVEQGKEKRTFDGREYILERPIKGDFALVRAHKADKRGNLVYRGSVRGCNPIMAMACRVTIAEVDEIVEAGELDPEVIVTPEVFVHRIVKIPEGSFGSRSYTEALLHRTLKALREEESR